MGYCFNLYTPDMKKQDSGKFVACEKLLFSNDMPFLINTIGYYEQYIGGKYLDIYNSVCILNEKQCKIQERHSLQILLKNMAAMECLYRRHERFVSFENLNR